MRNKFLLLSLVALGGAGCASQPDVVRFSVVESVPVSQAAIFPPPGGPAIATVLQRTNPDGMQQSILLATSSATPGDNYFKIRLSSGAVADVKDPDPRPIRSAADLDRELLAAFPDVRMAPSATVLQNAFGPFSYASGNGAAGEACLYAWQQIAASDDQKAPLTSRGGIQIRFRMCDGQRSERDLLMVMYGFTITAAVNSKGWNPYGMTLPTGATAPLSDGIVLPPRAATVCEQGAAPATECIFAPENSPVRLAVASPVPVEPRAAVPTEAVPSVAVPPVTAPVDVPLPPARAFDPAVPSPRSSSQPNAPTVMIEAARAAVPRPSELASSSQPASVTVSPDPAVPSPSGLGAAAPLPAEGAASAKVAKAPLAKASPPLRMIELSALPSSLRPQARPAETCKPDEGKVCPP
jgi:hypothetical protein